MGDLTTRQRAEKLVDIIEKTETIQIGTHEEIYDGYDGYSSGSYIEVPTYHTQFVHPSTERKQARKELKSLKKHSLDSELRKWVSKYFNIEKLDKFYNILDKAVVGPYVYLIIKPVSKIPILSDFLMPPLLIPLFLYTPYILASEGSHRELKRKKSLLMKAMPK